MSDAIRTFGTPIEGVEYTLRPGGYLVARDRTGGLAARDLIAVVETPAGLFLPGGGQDQTYVEDCSLCCRPNVLHVRWDEGDGSWAIEASRES